MLVSFGEHTLLIIFDGDGDVHASMETGRQCRYRLRSSSVIIIIIK